MQWEPVLYQALINYFHKVILHIPISSAFTATRTLIKDEFVYMYIYLCVHVYWYTH